jgi:hypothetical protein
MSSAENKHTAGSSSSEHIDYSEMYRTLELKQLNKRLRKVRNVLLFCALAIGGGALAFWVLPETSFKASNFFLYMGLAGVLILLAVLSNKKPYFSIISALVICIGFWTIEIILKTSDDLLIEGSIQKLVIISLLLTCYHTSKEAELIRKELHFS